MCKILLWNPNKKWRKRSKLNEITSQNIIWYEFFRIVLNSCSYIAFLLKKKLYKINRKKSIDNEAQEENNMNTVNYFYASNDMKTT